MRHLRVAITVLLIGVKCWADPHLPSLFTEHMVVQRDRDVQVWGEASPAEKITVSLAGRSASAITDANGRWNTHLPALAAGGPFTLTVQGNKTVVIKDVMIGEVWIASGQSNMAFALSGAVGSEIEIPKADYPQIRFFTVPKRISVSSQEDVPFASWQICTPDTAKSFSAVAYFFARELHRSLGIPIGIIHSSWPGTPIEEWVDAATLAADPELKSLLDPLQKASPGEKRFAENGLSLALEFDDFELIPAAGSGKPAVLADFNDGNARTSYGGVFSYNWPDAPDTTLELVSPGHGGARFAVRIAGQLDGAHSSFLAAHYRLDSSPVDLRAYAGLRFWVRGNGSYRFRSLQPSISDWDDYAAPVMQASSEWQEVTIWFRDLHQEGWGVVMPFTQDALSGFSIEALTTLAYAPMPVSGLYSGMIAPLLPFPVRGAIWYQGESNALKAYQYRKLLPALIASWREGSHNPDLEFLIVQLPNHGAIPEEPGESAWAELREAQLLTAMHVPRTGIAVTIDVGDPKDIHPHRKLEVGQRLALWALGATYRKPIVYSGPLYESMKIMEREIRIHFSQVGSGLEARGGDDLQGFEIAGPDRRFHWAKAHIEGDAVLVSSPEVNNPVAVRYAWADSPVCNLFNKDGLPASPFRTDAWPGITGGH